MKAASGLLSAVSAIVLTATPVVGGAIAIELLQTTSAHAAVVNAISVSGNVRVSEQSIADFVGYEPGRDYSAADVNDAVKALFRTGLFANASVVTRGGTLVVAVEELATVNQVLFQGNRKIKDDRLDQVVELAPRGKFDQATLDADVLAVDEAYARIGRADVTVTASVVDLGENRVNVVFQIDEGDRTRIAQINFTGNTAFSDRRLRSVISTKQSNFMSWLTRNDVYDDQRLAADEEQLRRFHFNRGYADFRILSSSVDTDPATGELIINFEIDEGERYAFGMIDIDNTVTGVDQEALARTIETRPGRVYSASEVEDTLIAMSEQLAANGFPFAEVTPVGNRNFETGTIDITYIVDQGQRAFVERIEIVGNTRTRDYVIRREFDISEGDAFNQFLVRRAQRRLEELRFFERVAVTTQPGSSPDRVVLVVQVQERSTGEFGVGVGYSTGGQSQGVNVTGSITERNFLGRGQAIKVAVGGTTDSRTYNVSFTEPYFLGYRVSATVDVFQERRNYSGVSGGYDKTSTGGAVTFGLPLNDNLRATVGYSYVQDEYIGTGACALSTGTDGPADTCILPEFIEDRIDAGGVRAKSAVSYGLIYNTIDDPVDPTEGVYARFNQEVAGLGGDAQFVRTTVDASYYHTVNEEAEVVALLRGGAGNITGLGQMVMGFDQFELGANRIRGFEYNGIGPTDASGNFIGGKTYINATAELQFAMPAFPRDLGVKGAVFADAATLFDTDVAGAINTSMEWRASAGVSLIWQSPVAPLRFDYAWPVVKEPHDKVQNFSFSVSTAF
ncbi:MULTISPECIES: outer membrane protein assembly factor BamA [unclassified Roseitalea]|uniref:outer membrane protein assembly factor BamA n=1 Tax=unclassified Roseitalea TaxID=2639107 RepID=UPI00273F0189|nr:MULTISPECIES: outer membrane protein assembly factor BamA [unclassified Roseitalea]